MVVKLGTAAWPVHASVVLRINSTYVAVYGDLSAPVTRRITRSYCDAVSILRHSSNENS